MVKVIGLYTISENQETDDDEEEEDISIQNEINKLFKFRICLCRRTGNGKLERISNFIDTQLVEESEFIVICVGRTADGIRSDEC
jgi:hypothetical protein